MSKRINEISRITVLSSNKKKLLDYVLVTFLVFSIAFSFLTYTFIINGYWSNYTGGGVFSSSEAKAAQWILDNLSEKATIVALSQDSYTKLTSMFSGKILPLFLEGTDIWPKTILMESQLPEAVLYSLNQMGANYIFVSAGDASLLSSSNDSQAFASLLQTFPLNYSSDGVSVYAVPQYPLFGNANYQVVSSMWNFPAFKSVNSFNETNNPIVVADDDQTDFWTPIAIGPGDGTLAAPIISNDVNTKYSGVDSLRLDIVSGGNYGAWMLTHNFNSTQDWSAEGFISMHVYGNNTGRQIYFQINTPDMSNSLYWIWTDNWIGWKTLAFSLENPDGSSGSVDLANVRGLVIGVSSMGDWRSHTGTFYFDRIVLSNVQTTTQEVAEQPNLFLSEMLIGQGVPYSIIPDTELSDLNSSNVYIFPYNVRISQEILDNLTNFLSNGAHVIFADPSFATSNQFGDPVLPLLNIMNFVRTTIVPINISQVVFADTTINSSFPISQMLNFTDASGLNIIASFKLQNNDTIPFIVQQKVGAGTITFINLSPLEGASEHDQAQILSLAREQIFAALPPPAASKTPLSLPIPVDLLKAFAGSTMEVWNNKNLQNVLLFQDDIKVDGDFTVNSSSMYLSGNSLFVREMQIKSSDDVVTIKNTLLSNVQILGLGTSSSTESEAIVRNYPGGEFNAMEISNTKQTSTNSFNFTNAMIEFSLDTGEKQVFSESNITITTSNSCSFLVRAEQPAIAINGTLSSILQGAFIHDDTFFLALSPSQVSIAGNFSLKFLYSSGITFAQIKVSSIENFNMTSLSSMG